MYIIWTIVRFRKGIYMVMGKYRYKLLSPTYAWLWDLFHQIAIIFLIGYFIIKYFP